MFKLVLEKAEEQEINWQHLLDHQKAREFQKNTFFCFIDYAKAFVWITINCGKFWKRWEYQTTWPASWEATVRTGHETTDWFQIQKWARQGCILSPCLFNFYAEYIKQNAGLEEAQAGIKIVRRNINNLRYADDTTLMAESEGELKSLLMKERERKSWLKAQHLENEDHGIWSHHFMGNRWGNRGNSVRLYFWGLQNHCRWWSQPWN